MEFHLSVVKGRDAPQHLIVEAPDAVDARKEAAAQGWTVLSCSGHKKASPLLRVTARQQRDGLIIFLEQTHALLNAGLSVTEVLETLQRGRSGPWTQLIRALLAHLREGQPLSQAMARHPEFPGLLIAMVQSAEVTSNLKEALKRYLEHAQRSAQVRHQLVSVGLYPALLLAVGGAVMLFLLLYVMPRFARVFENMTNLPWSAQAMVLWARLLHEHGWQMLAALAVLAGLIATTLLTPGQRRRFQAWVLRLKPIEQRLQVYFLARWYRTVGMLVDGGIPLPESLGLAKHVLPISLRLSGETVEQAMRQGLSPSDAFIKGGMTTPVAEQLLRAGERSGDVGLMLTRTAEFHELEVTKSLENAMRVIEPLVMTFIGVGVGVVVILMYLPIFELASAIQ